MSVVQHSRACRSLSESEPYQLDRQHFPVELDTDGAVRYLDENDKHEPREGIVPEMRAVVSSKGYRGS